MFPPPIVSLPIEPSAHNNSDVGDYRQPQAQILYDGLHLKAKLGKALAFITRRRMYLLALQEDLSKKRVLGRRYAGIQSVAIDRIRGSENRVQDFDASFKPLVDKNHYRWVSVAEAELNGVPLPPVELIQAGDIYYVRDGHHRVSVAKALGKKFIEAEVNVWKIETASPHAKPAVNVDLDGQLTALCA